MTSRNTLAAAKLAYHAENNRKLAAGAPMAREHSNAINAIVRLSNAEMVIALIAHADRIETEAKNLSKARVLRELAGMLAINPTDPDAWAALDHFRDTAARGASQLEGLAAVHGVAVLEDAA